MCIRDSYSRLKLSWLLGSLLTTFFLRFHGNFTNLSILCRVLLNFLLLGKIPETIFSRVADKSPTNQNIVQAHGMSRVRRVSPLPTVRDRPGSSPASFPGHGWSQKAPCIRRAHLVHSAESTHRHREICTKSPAIFLSWTALSRDKLSIVRSRGTVSPLGVRVPLYSTIKRMPSACASGFDDPIRCTSVATS